MKTILTINVFIFILLGCITSCAAPLNIEGKLRVIYASPNGNKLGKGTLDSPLDLRTATRKVMPGGWIYLRGGLYKFEKTLRIPKSLSGLSKKRTFLVAYHNEQPVLNFAKQIVTPKNKGIALHADFWHIERIAVEHAGDNGVFISGSHNIVANVITRHNADTGLKISRGNSKHSFGQWPAYNKIIDCESHDNRDPEGKNADGFAAKLSVGPGNIFKGCMAHHNADDGWDLSTEAETGPIGVVVIENSFAFRNGNGFKLGGEDIAVNHELYGNRAFENRKHGFHANSNPGKMVLTNNIAADNLDRNFNFATGQAVFHNNTSCRHYAHSARADLIAPYREQDNDWWFGENKASCIKFNL